MAISLDEFKQMNGMAEPTTAMDIPQPRRSISLDEFKQMNEIEQPDNIRQDRIDEGLPVSTQKRFERTGKSEPSIGGNIVREIARLPATIPATLRTGDGPMKTNYLGDVQPLTAPLERAVDKSVQQFQDTGKLNVGRVLGGAAKSTLGMAARGLEAGSYAVGVGSLPQAVGKQTLKQTATRLAKQEGIAGAMQGFGSSTARQIDSEQPSVGNVFIETLLGGAGGAVLGTGLGVAGQSLRRGAQLSTQKGRQELSDEAVKSATQSFKELFPTVRGRRFIDSIESRYGDEVPELIVRSGILRDADIVGNKPIVGNTVAYGNLRKGYGELEELYQMALDPAIEPRLVNIDEVYKSALGYIQNSKYTPDTKRQMASQLAREIESVQSMYGDTLNLQTLNQLKRQFWQEAFPSSKLVSDMDRVARNRKYIVGSAMRDAIERNAINPDIKELNRALGTYAEAFRMLDEFEKQTLKKGQLGRYVLQGIGTGIGTSAGGPLGGILGALTGDVVTNLLQRLSVNSPVRSSLIKYIRTYRPDLIETVEKFIKQRAGEVANAPRLNAGPIIVPPRASESTSQLIPAGKGTPGRDPKTGRMMRTYSSTGENLNKVQKPNQKNIIQSAVENLKDPRKSQGGYIATPLGKQSKAKVQGESYSNIIPYKGFKDLTTTILKDLEGKTTVSKQYILDATNRGELKQVERDLIRRILDESSDTNSLAIEAKKYKSAEEFVKANESGVLYHGSPTGEFGGGAVHVGTKKAAQEALEARIGIPASGKGWDGTTTYGDTLLAGQKTLKKLDPKGYNRTGFNVDVPQNDFYLKDHPELVKATFGDGNKIPLNAKPNLFPVKIKGEMTNLPDRPLSDVKANATIAGQLKKGTAKRGYYYENIGEDAGSISAVVPSKNHLERSLTKSQLTDIWNKAQGSDTINVSDFAKKVKAELLPLKRSITTGDPGMFTKGEDVLGTPHYESIVLPDELRGKVKDYQENIYQSPVKTSAGQTHFSNLQNKPENYFGHTRIEDMADNKTRRVIEVQSDLYQKGNLENEIVREPFKEMNERIRQAEKDEDFDLLRRLRSGEEGTFGAREKIDELQKLKQYNNPTAHFRMVREEIKKAAQDGKTKLQFPTGETAMKIEGLGSRQFFSTTSSNGMEIGLTPELLEVGKEIQQGRTNWIITDVLGDGKFKAVQKSFVDIQPSNWKITLETESGKVMPESSTEKGLVWVARNEKNGRMEFQPFAPSKKQDALTFLKEKIGSKDKSIKELGEAYGETFDISGKVDTNNPIYRFYEKDLAKYLKSKYNATPVTDNKGVTWYEVDVKPEYGKLPVEAFGLVPFVGLGALKTYKEKRDPNLPKKR